MLYENDGLLGVSAASAGKIKRILAALEFADDLSQISSLPRWKLHQLKGNRSGEIA